MRKQVLLCTISIFAAACATTPNQESTGGPQRPRPSVVPLEKRVTVSDPAAERAELRAAIEQSYAMIVARAQAKAIPIADADAALSMEIPEHRAIRGAVRYFSTDLRGSIQQSLTRSAQYKQLIDPVLDEYGLPRAFAYLPVIESAYLPNLTSRAGARGIWQLMPETARDYGLRVDWWVDERTNPEKSTRVAAKFLRDLWNEFHDWPLVLAAYNAGPGRVRRTLAAHEASTFWELLEKSALPKETRGYVPTFFATIIIVSDPETHGFTLQAPADYSDHESVVIAGPVSFDYIASLTGLSTETLKELNPEFRRAVVPPGRSRIKLPKEAATLVAANADSLRNEDPYVDVASFTLRRGDTLTQLARLLGHTKDDILAMNGVSSENQLRPGDAIYLPVRQARLSTLLNPVDSPADQFHIVEQGDTLYSIARSNGLRVEELLDLNQLGSSTSIQPGQKLRVKLGTAMSGGM